MRIGVLFGAGSVCFALGSLPGYVADLPGPAVAWTFVVGSVFFTSAAALQLAGTDRALRWDRLAGWVQLVGTVCFNVSTLAATRDLAEPEARRLVWAPDVYGSVCFLVASGIAYALARRGARPRSAAWWVAALNLAGSVAFGIAAVAARYVGDTTDPTNLALVNLGTFLGAVAFLAGAALLPASVTPAMAPRRDRRRAPG
ncbi:hypothetical protein HGA09_12840 [Cellulomonas hominis]|nr:hypothetical protein [Cellulomonas hominis]